MASDRHRLIMQFQRERQSLELRQRARSEREFRSFRDFHRNRNTSNIEEHEERLRDHLARLCAQESADLRRTQSEKLERFDARQRRDIELHRRGLQYDEDSN